MNVDPGEPEMTTRTPFFFPTLSNAIKSAHKSLCNDTTWKRIALALAFVFLLSVVSAKKGRTWATISGNCGDYSIYGDGSGSVGRRFNIIWRVAIWFTCERFFSLKMTQRSSTCILVYNQRIDQFNWLFNCGWVESTEKYMHFTKCTQRENSKRWGKIEITQLKTVLFDGNQLIFFHSPL